MTATAPTDDEWSKRMVAAGMIWDDGKQDWVPDPAVWGDHDQ